MTMYGSGYGLRGMDAFGDNGAGDFAAQPGFDGVPVSPQGRRGEVRLPDGWQLEANGNPDPYEKLNQRDYPRLSFRTLMTEDYGDYIAPDMPLGTTDSGPLSEADRSVFPDRGNPEAHLTRSMQYADLLTSLPADRAAELGVDLDLLLNERDTAFCESFLGFMAFLGHQSARILQLGGMHRSVDVRAATTQLATALTPAIWRPHPTNDRDWSTAVGSKPLTGDYKQLIHKVAAGDTASPRLHDVHAYRLQPLNQHTWLYLCSDGQVRVRVDTDMLLPLPAADVRHAPTCNINVDFVKRPAEDAVHIAQEMINSSGERHTYKAIRYSPRVHAYPAKQRLADIAGRVLVSQAQTA